MVIYLAGAILFAGLFYISTGEELEGEEVHGKIKMSFYQMAHWIVRRILKKTGKEAYRETKKVALTLMVLFFGFLVLPVLDYGTMKKEKQITDYSLIRPEKGEGSKEYQVLPEVEEQSEIQEVISVQMKEREFTEEEKEEILLKAKEEIDEKVIGDNNSPDDVRGKVVLPSTLQNGNVSVFWIQDPQGLLEEDGTIVEDLEDSGEILILKALMNCEGIEETYEFALHLKPEIRSEEEELAYQLRKAVEEAQEESVSDSQMVLPRQINGKTITWSFPGYNMIPFCIAGILICSVMAYIGTGKEFEKEDAVRERQLLLDYPNIVFKLGMLLNAGLTIQNAFQKITDEYKEHQQVSKRHAYEEMLYTCNEMKSGIAEARAYENFGRRCGKACYIRLGTTLSSGLQKSAEGITTLLLKEADQAMEERRLLARKMGEEAGTKLLFPMLLMLLVVMVILMVPAMLSF